VQLALLLAPPPGWPKVDGVPEAEIELLSGLDKVLSAVFLPGAFVWPAELAPVFPAQSYWYLYGHLKET
jgi:hypothetical protein